MVFIDTSAFYAILDRDDSCHAAARHTWNQLLDSRAPLLTTNYVLLETTAIVQRRIGLAAVRTFQEDIIPVLTVDWVTPSRHNAALDAVLTANRRDLSLVDCVSFQSCARPASGMASRSTTTSPSRASACFPTKRTSGRNIAGFSRRSFARQGKSAPG